MDLGSVKMKLLSHQYSSPAEFASDVRLTFKNAMTYNSPGNPVHIFAVTLSKFFESRWKVIERKISSSIDVSTPSKSSVIVEPEIAYLPPAKKQKTASVLVQTDQKADHRLMSGLEKEKLSAELEALLEELPDNIVHFLKETTSNESNVNEDEIEIDIDVLNDDTLFSLRKLLDDYLTQKKEKLSQCKIETHRSGFSDTHMETYNELVDEKVDVSENNPQSVVIDRQDAVQRINECDSASCSDSEPNSSSSDSEGFAGEADDMIQELQFMQDTLASTEEPNRSDPSGPNDHMNGHHEQKLTSNLDSVEPKCHQEGMQ